MRRLTKTAALVLALSSTALLPASAGTPTVGGPKGAAMAFSFTATGPQQHVLAETAGSEVPGTPDPEVTESCVVPRCAAFPFNLVGARKGAKSATMSAQITWGSPTSRFWLLLMDVSDPSAPYVVDQCFTFYTSAGTSATVSDEVKLGRKYAIWVTVQQVGVSDVVKGVVHSPAKDTAPSSQISGADPTGLFLNPCQG